MERMLYVEQARKDEIITNAIQRETQCVITRRSAQGWRTYKSTFAPTGPFTDRLFVVIPQGNGPDDRPEFVPGEQLGIAFRRGHKKSMFAAVVVSHGWVPSDDGGADVECVELQWPSLLQELQRRAYFRAEPPGRKIHVRFWRGGVIARSQIADDGAGLFGGVLHDLSAGGMRVLTTDVSPDTFVAGDPCGCSFTPKQRGETLVLDATYRHFQYIEDGLGSLGFQFVGLETTERGRITLVKLARVVADYQRAQSEPRRQRRPRDS